MDNPFKIGDKVMTVKMVPSYADNPALVPGEVGTVVWVGWADENPECGDMEVEFYGVKWRVNHQEIEKVESQAEKFIAEFNLTLIGGRDIAEIHFHDGSVAKYGRDWLD